MTYGGQVFYGIEDIKDKIESFAFKSINYSINDKDIQIGRVNGSILISITVQLIMDNNEHERFTFFQIFNICPNGSGGYYIHNDIFRTMG